MFKELAGFANLLKNAQGIGERFRELTDRLRDHRVQGDAGEGMVRVEMCGTGVLLSIQVDTQLMKSEEKALLEQLIPLAVNQASSKAKQAYAEGMKQLAAELNLPIPGLDQLLSQFR